MTEKYNASNISLEQILSYIKSEEIAIPEIQRHSYGNLVRLET